MLLVAAGGAVGSVGRYLLSGWALHHTAAWRFPLGTFLVNVVGCLFVGILAGLVEQYELFSSDTRLFLFTGIAGGFTTFSAFSLEAFHLLRRGEALIAGGYIASSFIVGLLLLWGGFAIVTTKAA